MQHAMMRVSREIMAQGQGYRRQRMTYTSLNSQHTSPAHPKMEEGTDLRVFFPSRSHQLILEVYSDYIHHKYWGDLNGGIIENSLWHIFWKRLNTQSTNWFADTSGAARRRFTMHLAEKWWGM